MGSHVFSEIFIHLNWHTKADRPLLKGDLEAAVHEFLRERIDATKGVWLHAIGGTLTHVHLAIRIEPFVCISDLVGDIKGACSREMNKRCRRKALEWQRGFGAVSFGHKQLDWVKRYVQDQKQHHQQKEVFDKLERFDTWQENEKPR